MNESEFWVSAIQKGKFWVLWHAGYGAAPRLAKTRHFWISA
jgi:hypothetical protein